MIALGLALLAGLLTSLSPCVLPVLPLVVGGALTRHRLGPVALCAGLGLSFVVLGTVVALATQAFGFDPAIIRTIGAMLLLAFGIALLVPGAQENLSRWLSPLASWAGGATSDGRTAGLAGNFLTGAALGAVWSPCSGPTLGAAIGLVTQAGTALRGVLLMVTFALGAVLPLLAVAYGSRAAFNAGKGRLMTLSSKAKPVFGVILLVVGVGILTGWDKQAEAAILARLPEGWVSLITRF